MSPNVSYIVLWSILFDLQISLVNTSRILAFFPTPSISHQFVFRRITDELVKEGHHVTVITTDPKYTLDETPQNLTEINVHDVSYKIWGEILNKIEDENIDDEYTILEKIYFAMSVIFKSQIESVEVQDLIYNKKLEFDLILLEAYVKPALIMSHLFKAPVILISSCGATLDNSNSVGKPVHPFLYPIMTQTKLYNLTYLEKLQSLYNNWRIDNLIQNSDKNNNIMLKKLFGSDTPTLNQLSNNIDMLFLNIHPIWVDNQPVPTNVIFISGIHAEPPKALPQNLQAYLDSSKKGVIYFSLGTNVLPENLPSHKIQIIKRVFSQLPYNILWKWNNYSLPGKSENIKISEWFPQNDLLRHPNIKLFITQGGLQSTDEAISAGAPFIGIPMLGDQWYNVQKYVHHGIGLQLDMNTLTEDEFRIAINKVIDHKSFRENVMRLRSVIEYQPMSSLQRAIWWINHVLQHGGGKHLRGAGANISWNEYLELDIVFLIFLSILATVVIILIYVYLTWCYCLKKILCSDMDDIKKIKST